MHTCDGEQLLILCPRKTTISILGAFYGRRVPSPNLCPSPGNVSQESTECMSPTAHLVRAASRDIWGRVWLCFGGISRRAGCAASPVLSPSESSLGGGAAAAQPAPKASVPSTSSQRGRYQVRREASSPSCGRELALHGAVLERGWGCEGVARSCKTCACLQGCCAEPCARGCACRGAAWSSRNVHSYLQRRCMELCQRA